MKKSLTGLLTILIVVGLCACGNAPQSAETTNPTVVSTDAATTPEPEETTAETTEQTIETTGVPEAFVFPAGITVCGVDMEGKTAEEGYESLSEKLTNYSLSFTINEHSFRVTGGSMGLYYPEDDFMATAEALARGQDAAFDESLRYSESALQKALRAKTDLAPVNASASYNSAKQVFTVTAGRNGHTTDLTEALKKASKIIPSLGSDKVSVQAKVTPTVPKITSEDPTLSAAVKKANSMISVNLSYTYAPTGAEAKVEALSRNDLAGFLVFHAKNMAFSFSDTALSNYTKKMNDKYQNGGSQGKFHTTGGGTVNLMVDYIGQGVNTEALARDIRHCMENGISGNRTATYLDPATCSTMPYNGTYIEVNLSAQRAWFYKSGELIVTCPIVSGCVSKGWRTPTGVYSVYSRFTNSWISGGTAYVNCFMAYNGNYGLHDATWRDEFGGDIYLTNGSHGCTNMPKDAALTIYRNSSIGTKVIIYGGATSVDMITQEISGTASYRLPSNSAPFMLDAAAVHGTEPLKYISSDPNIVTVDAEGRVEVKKIGNATITVTCEESGYYTSAQKAISIEVYSACPNSNHLDGEWVITKEPSCANGEETFTCICGQVLTRPIPAVDSHKADSKWTVSTKPTCTAPGTHTGSCTVCNQRATLPLEPLGHSFSSSAATCNRGCGAKNPNYTPPTVPEETKPTEPEVTKPTEPEVTKPTEPEETKPTEPEVTKPTEPEETKPTEPEETKPTEPEDTTPSEPEDTTPSEPEDTTPSEPEDTTPSEPEDTTPSEPEDTTPSEPEDTTPSEPQDTTPSEPEDTTPSEPEDTTPSEPEDSTVSED